MRECLVLPRDARVLFLPQRPYLPLGTLREVLSYPDRPDRHDDGAYAEALEACRLPQLSDRLDENGNWAMALSPGRAAAACLRSRDAVRPDWLFLDEASSALDEATEAEIYRALKRHLPTPP